jgi:tRNA (adenine37-N6)-methyltransferase
MSESNHTHEREFRLRPIGVVRRFGDRIVLQIDAPYRPALRGLDGFSHVQVFWWFDRFDDDEHRATTIAHPPFDAPELGVFAVKSPMRPNPIALTVVKILSVDESAGTIGVPRIDAFDGTPVLDIKGYMPAVDRVADARVPDWAADWPDAMPDAGLALDRVPGE